MLVIALVSFGDANAGNIKFLVHLEQRHLQIIKVQEFQLELKLVSNLFK